MKPGTSLLAPVLFIANFLTAQVNIEPTIMGQAYWTSDHNVTYPTPPVTVPQWPDVKQSGVRLVRAGGIAYNAVNTGSSSKPPFPLFYVTLVDEIRKNGCEPVITIPFVCPLNPTTSQLSTAITNSEINAKEIIRIVNIVHKRRVKYVILGNEPNIEYGFTSTADAIKIHDYIVALAKAVKDVDPEIKTIGPEFSWYNKAIYDLLFPTSGSTTQDISGTITSAGMANGKPYIDFISVHQYLYDFQLWDINDPPPTTAFGTYTWLEQVQKAQFDDTRRYRGVLKDLREKCDAISLSRGIPLEFMITEANESHDNQTASDPNLSGWDTRSFLGGQLWARMLSLAMEYKCSSVMFWSVRESTTGNMEDRGYIAASGTLRPSYYHYKAMSKWFHGEYYKDKILDNALIASNANSIAPGCSPINQTTCNYFWNPSTAGDFTTIAFASRGENITVMVLNRSASAENFSIELDGNTSFSGSPAHKFSFPILSPSSFTQMDFNLTGINSPIAANSSVILVFDCSGNLLERHHASGSSDFTLAYQQGTPQSISSNVQPTTPPCLNSGISYIDITAPGNTYSWFTVPSTVSYQYGNYTGANISSNLSNGAYITEISGGTMCAPVEVLNVIYERSGLVDAGPDHIICGSGTTSVTLGNINAPGSPYTYSWAPVTASTPTTTQPVSAGATDTYTLYASDGNGCDLHDAVSVIDEPLGDLYIKDTPEDDGTEANPGDPWNLVDGEDVWVRNFPDQQVCTSPSRYANEHLHQSPEWRASWATQTDRPFIYVKIRNRSCSTITGNVRIYYHNFSGNDKWDTYGTNPNQWGVWEEILCGDYDGDGFINGTEVLCGDLNNNGVIDGSEVAPHSITLGPGEETVIEQEWNNVSQTMVFPQPSSSRDEWCLLVRLESVDDPISGEVFGVSAGWNAQASNNIVQKNVTFINDVSGLICTDFEYGNYYDLPTVNRLDMVDQGTSQLTGVQGYPFIDLDPELYSLWTSGGKQGSGFVEGRDKYKHFPTAAPSSPPNHTHDPLSVDRHPYQLVLVNPNAYLDNVVLAPNTEYPVCVTFNFIPGTVPDVPFEYSFRHYEAISPAPLVYAGAVKYRISKPKCLQVNAGRDLTIQRFCSTTLRASPSPAPEGAVFTWRLNSSGITVGTGQQLQVTPYVTTEYEVEMRTPDGCVSYDWVTITVANGVPCTPSCSSVDYNSAVLYGVTNISNTTKVISGILTIPDNAVLNIVNSTLIFLENSAINILQGGKLTLDKVVLTACDQAPNWDGITVNGNNLDGSQLSILESVFLAAQVPVTLNNVNGSRLSGNIFVSGSTGILLNNCKDFEIEGNRFYDIVTGIDARNNLVNQPSTISRNYFDRQNKCIQLIDGNFNALDITCNLFDNYSLYGIYSNNSNLKDQGTSLTAAGNLFLSTSTQVNHQLRYNGIPITYYCNPSSPFNLVTDLNFTARSMIAAGEPDCSGTELRSTNSDLTSDLTPNQNNLLNCIPNPASDRVAFIYSLPANAVQVHISLQDIFGKSIGTLDIAPGSVTRDYDCSALANGIYFYTLIVDGQPVSSKKMIIAR